MMFQDLLGPSNSVSNSVLAKPYEPVSAIRGKSSALASPMLAVAGGQYLLGHADVGPAIEQLGGKAGGDRGGQLLLLEGAPAQDRRRDSGREARTARSPSVR